MQYFSSGEKPILGEIRAGLFKTAPAGWLLLDGSTFDKTEYPRLFELLGTNTLPDMRAATICGKGDAVPDMSDISPAVRNKTNYDSGKIGDVVGENAQRVPQHMHGIVFDTASEYGNRIVAKTSGGTDSGYGISLSTGTGCELYTDKMDTFGETIYTDVRGKRLLCNFIIRAV